MLADVRSSVGVNQQTDLLTEQHRLDEELELVYNRLADLRAKQASTAREGATPPLKLSRALNWVDRGRVTARSASRRKPESSATPHQPANGALSCLAVCAVRESTSPTLRCVQVFMFVFGFKNPTVAYMAPLEPDEKGVLRPICICRPRRMCQTRRSTSTLWTCGEFSPGKMCFASASRKLSPCGTCSIFLMDMSQREEAASIRQKPSCLGCRKKGTEHQRRVDAICASLLMRRIAKEFL